MYIGKLGDGSQNDDGIYVLLKEVLDNAIDEYMMGFGKQIDIEVSEYTVGVRDYGRGIPLDKVVDVSSKMNTGAKYDSKAFKKSVGLNGVGIKAVNALSTDFYIKSVRDGKSIAIEYSCGEIVSDSGIMPSDEPNGTFVRFTPDNSIFRDYRYREEYVVPLVKNYTFLNTGLSIYLNGKRYFSRNGLLDLLKENLTTEPLYPIIHLKGNDIEAVITHTKQIGEEYYSFVNGQHTTRAEPTCRLSARLCHAPSRSTSAKTLSTPTFATASSPPYRLKSRSRYLNHRPKPSSARVTWGPKGLRWQSSSATSSRKSSTTTSTSTSTPPTFCRRRFSKTRRSARQWPASPRP